MKKLTSEKEETERITRNWAVLAVSDEMGQCLDAEWLRQGGGVARVSKYARKQGVKSPLSKSVFLRMLVEKGLQAFAKQDGRPYEPCGPTPSMDFVLNRVIADVDPELLTQIRAEWARLNITHDVDISKTMLFRILLRNCPDHWKTKPDRLRPAPFVVPEE